MTLNEMTGFLVWGGGIHAIGIYTAVNHHQYEIVFYQLGVVAIALWMARSAYNKENGKS
ncbi:hypothetical protein [Pseudomonas monachiensis]|uniref:Uncharacterized protein n=1 Tax=Pseudomonas monachiensis TaxID=3060212 RepID=A0ABW9H7Q2_9PSED